MKTFLYCGNEISCDIDINFLKKSMVSAEEFNKNFESVTVETFDGIKMTLEADKWVSEGHQIMSTCQKGLKITTIKKKE